MMEKKYELVAWTRSIADKEDARLFVIPSLKHELHGDFCTEVSEYRKELSKNHGNMTIQLARRFIRVYEQSARLELLTGDCGWAIRFLLMAADYCVYDNELGYCSRFNAELRSEFGRLCEDAIHLAHRHGLEHILINEDKPRKTMEHHRKLIRKDREPEKSAI